MRIAGLRWCIAGLLLVATIINYLDRQTLSVLAPELRDRFGMSNTDYSRVLFAFMLAYTFGQSATGRIMDRLGTRMGFSLAISFWSAATMLHAAARSAFHLGLCRFLLALGQAGNWPGGVKAVAEWFPPRERAFAVGLFNSGSCLGAVIAPPLVIWIALGWGWPAAFLLTGVLGFFWLAAWLTFYRLPDRHPWISAEELERIRTPSTPQPQRKPPRWLRLLRLREVWGLVLARSLADPVWWFYVFWLPEYLKRERDFSLAMIGYFAWIPFLTAALGNFAGGALSGYLIRRGCQTLPARKTVMFASASVMLVGIPAVLTPDPVAALALISLATFAYSSWAANILTLPSDLFPADTVASVSGLSGTGAGLGGMAFMLLVGWVLDRYGYVPVFTVAALMPLAAASLILWGVRTRKTASPVMADSEQPG